ncbi:hypothetical protein AB0K05_23920 [Nonomuraea sp. NPDC049486]|uniref:hypothetical protein n=1 Tax=Nonomuraea sp. NPDC049486 TaxID=3155773 RepID=UPI0034157C2F
MLGALLPTLQDRFGLGPALLSVLVPGSLDRPSPVPHDDLTPQYRHLMPEHHDLGVQGRLASAQEDQPAEYPDHDQIQEMG